MLSATGGIKKLRTPSDVKKSLPTRAPNSDIQLQLISDIGPELVQRWTEAKTILCGNGGVIPAMYRALLSAVLRAPSFTEADDFMASYRGLGDMHGEVAGGVLGFSSNDDAFTQTSVLYDLLSSASRGEPLLPDGPALLYYISAGAGSGDTAEYHTATVDQRVEFCQHKDNLHDVRLYALSLVVDAYANAVEKGKSGTILNDVVARFNTNNFVAMYVDTLANNVDRLHENISKNLHKFYNAYYAGCNDTEQRDFRSRLVRSVMRLAYDRPANVLRFLQGVIDPALRFSICRLCLVQRFGVADSPEGRLTSRRLVKYYLKLAMVEGRANAAVPGLLAGLLSGWEASGTDEDFKIPKDRLPDRVVALKKLKWRDWSTFGGPPGDILALKVSMMVVCYRLMLHVGKANIKSKKPNTK